MIDLEIDTRGVERFVSRGFRKLEKMGADLRPILRELRKPVVDDQRDHRKKREGSDGKWPALATSTRDRYRQMRRAGRKPPRGLLGRLPAAFKIRFERKRLVLESRVKRFSRAHQEGLRVRHGRLPKREYYWISRSLLAAAQDVVVRELAKASRMIAHRAQVMA